MLQLNYEALKGYCGGYQPGYPRGGPIRPSEQGMGRAGNSKEDMFGLLVEQGIQSDRDQHL